MATSPAERQYILAQIDKVAASELTMLWQRAESLSSADFAAFIIGAFPELADPYAALAAEAATVWYEDTPSTQAYVPTPGPLPLAEQLTSSASWALGATGLDGLDRLHGTLQRAVSDAARNTILHNVDQESGALWARHASSNACAFCAMAATRGAVYTSKSAAEQVVGRGKEMSLMDRRIRAAGGDHRVNGQAAAGGIRSRGSQELGKKYHDRCHCIAVEVRPGGSYNPPDYVQKWEEAYITATRETPGKGKYGAIDTNAVLAHMRDALGSH